MNTMPKPKVEVISPAGECNCSFSTWINKVWDILNEYRDRLEIVSLVSDSPRVKELGVGGRSVVVDGEVVPVFELEQNLRVLLKRRH